MKKLFSIVMIVLIGCFLLSGCGLYKKTKTMTEMPGLTYQIPNVLKIKSKTSNNMNGNVCYFKFDGWIYTYLQEREELDDEELSREDLIVFYDELEYGDDDSNDEYQEKNIQIITIDDYPAKQFDVSYIENGFTYYSRMVVIYRYSNLYTFECIGTTEEYLQGNLETFDQVIKSIQFTKQA